MGGQFKSGSDDWRVHWPASSWISGSREWKHRPAALFTDPPPTMCFAKNVLTMTAGASVGYRWYTLVPVRIYGLGSIKKFK
jgi:hypothetical protein